MEMSKAITSRIEPQLAPFIDVRQQLDALVHEINEEAPKPTMATREITAAERISEDLVKLLIADSQNVLTQAQNLLHDDEVFAEHVRNEVQRRAERHANFLERLHRLKNDHEKSRQEFQSNNGQGE
jgi:Rad3-related DNA helicase